MSEYLSPVILSFGVLILSGVVIVTDVFVKKLKLILLTLQQQKKDREWALKKGRCSSSLKMSSTSQKSRRPAEKKTKKSSKTASSSSGSRRKQKETKDRKQKTIANYDYGKEVKLYDGDVASLVSQVAPFLKDFRDHPEQHDVCNPTVVPGFLYNALPSHPPELPCSLEAVWTDYKTLVWPGVTQWQHPYFLAYFPCGRGVPDTLAELLISAISVPTSSWYVCPSLAELEMSMVNWMGRALGLPETMLYHGNVENSKGGGLILESASEAIFEAVTAARTKKINDVFLKNKELSKDHYHADPKMQNKLDKHHEIAGRLVNYSSTEAHSSIEKACRMGMVELRQLKGDPNKDFALTAEILEKAIKEDLAAGKIPCMLNVILGSTSSCCFDELNEIGPVAKQYGMWVHADSAYAGSMWVDPSLRGTQKGIEHLDSIDVNPHKILLHSNGMSMLWTTNLAAIRRTYGRYEEKNLWDPMGDDTSGMAVHDCRRHKGLKSWLTFRLMGTDGLKDFIGRIVSASAYLYSCVVQHSNVRMFGKPKPGVFTFQYVEPGWTEEQISFHSECVHRYMNETGRIWITFSRVHGHGIIRVAIGYEKVCNQDMDNLWAIMKRCLDTYREKRTDPSLLRYPPESPSLHTGMPSALVVTPK